mmetsp:Transcript_56541/g.143008  ORF Transcript_56541/g.143008 Transcript_56541/m.143008 type:complete len:1723 (+) Transcript_56541:60-5228(+)|eukprot:CAMPEP_0115209400 /NCGR_PEP_ID=MMETSP0270-20121206/21717_1 /TAXON_ID=71861 /ORGANISM="Scrippsiella trochoidea, Strain CCMP3099" /LENGTH=1722 /DNA_ID=CAMNT_0002623033 /DNA_START=60 /DNA_END=5228 /DNA_ORIENTATION=-
MPELHKREKVLVQYRLLKDFDELRRRGLPGIDVRVMEENIYEWHVTMSPISGHFSGLRLHLVLLFPEDYPRRPPKVEICTYLPHANVFRDFLKFAAAYWGGYTPKRGSYVICTDLLEDKAPPLDPADARRYDGWSASYGVEAVLVQLQCLLFDDYIQSEDGNYINTLWDSWWSRPGEGRKSAHQICQELHHAQKEADEFICRECGFCGFDGRVAFFDKPTTAPEEGEGEAKEGYEEDGDIDSSDEEASGLEEAESTTPNETSRKPKASKFTSRKKQRKLEHEKLRKKSATTKVDLKKQNLYMEISNSNSALLSGHALRRVPGVFKPRDVVSFHFHGVQDESYVNGHRCINRNLDIFNYGHEVQFPWCTFDILTQRWIYHKKKPEEEQVKEANKGKASWQRFVNSQGGGGAEAPEDTPGTEAYVSKREQFYAAGVVEFVDPHSRTVSIVVAGSDGKLGAYGGKVTEAGGRWGWDSEAHNDTMKATLYKNVPMEKVKLHGNEEKGVVPYEHEPPVNYRPCPGKYADDERLPYDLQKDMPAHLLKLLAGGESSGLTKQKLSTLPEGRLVLLEALPAPAAMQASAASGRGVDESSAVVVAGQDSASRALAPADDRSSEQSYNIVDGAATEHSFEIVSLAGQDAAHGWETLSELAGSSVSSFDIVSVIEESRPRGSQSAQGSEGLPSALVSSFHIVPTALSSALCAPSSGASSADALGGCLGDIVMPSIALRHGISESEGHAASSSNSSRQASDLRSVSSSQVSSHSVLSLLSGSISARSSDALGVWQFLRVLCKLNIPVRGFMKSIQDFGAFFSIDATPRNLVVQNQKLLPSSGARSKGKGKGKGKTGKGRVEADKLLEDGLLPCLSYMRSQWPARSQAADASAAATRKSKSVMVSGNVFDDLAKARDTAAGLPDITVYVSEVDSDRRRLKLSLQPKLVFEELEVGGEYEGIVVDASKQKTLGLFVALSDDLTGLLHKTQLGPGAFDEEPDDSEWYRRSVYRVGDRIKVWVLRKALDGEPTVEAARESRRRFKIDLTMDSASAEVRQLRLERFLQVLDEGASGKHAAEAGQTVTTGKTAMDLQVQQTFNKEDRFFLLKNNRLIQQAEQAYPELVIDYTTDPPPPPLAEEKTKKFDFSLIEGWTVQRISEEYRRLVDKKNAYERACADTTKPVPKDVKPLTQAEEKIFIVLQKKVDQWGTEYYDRITKKIDAHQKMIKDINDKLKEERDKYPYKSIIDLDKFRELTERIQEKGYDSRCCFVTRLSYKEDVLGVGLEIVPEADSGRKVFQCSFDLISKEAFYDFGIRTGVWKDRIQFWMPAAIDSSHFRRALPYLAHAFKELGDGRVEQLTRSYGTQAGSAKFNLAAQLREAERSGQKIMSLDDYRKAQAARRNKLAVPSPAPSEAASSEHGDGEGRRPLEAPNPTSAVGLTEADVSYGLEVLPKLMNLQTVQLMKGDLHLSTKALEGYMGFHHLLLSILRQYPSLQVRVERKIGAFLRDEESRAKKACPNMGEFLCLLAVSKKYTWDDVSKAVLKETLDRNASWAIDKFPILARPGIDAQVRLEKTFKASIVSIRLLCFNVWFLRNIVFKQYGEKETAASIVAQGLSGGDRKNCMDRRWDAYEERKGVPLPSEVDLLQEQMRKMMHGDGLNSWAEYFINLNLKPLKGKDLSQLLFMCLHDAVRKGYIPTWKLRPKPVKEKTSGAEDHMGASADKFDSMFTTSGGNKW